MRTNMLEAEAHKNQARTRQEHQHNPHDNAKSTADTEMQPKHGVHERDNETARVQRHNTRCEFTTPKIGCWRQLNLQEVCVNVSTAFLKRCLCVYERD